MLKMTKASWGLLVLLVILLGFLVANYVRDNSSNASITSAPSKMSWNFVTQTPAGSKLSAQ